MEKQGAYAPQINLSHIVAVLDDITDLMQDAGKEVEPKLCRITESLERPAFILSWRQIVQKQRLSREQSRLTFLRESHS